MSKIKNFLSEWVEWDLFFSQCFAFVVFLALSVGLQSFLFWIGGMFQSVTNLGLYLDIGMFALVLVLVTLFLDSAQIFPFKGTRINGKICIFIAYLAVIGFYVFVIYPTYPWWMLIALCYVLLALSWVVLERLKADTEPVHVAIGIGLIYCLGAYFAMLINGLEPAIGIKELTFIGVAAIVEWFALAFD